MLPFSITTSKPTKPTNFTCSQRLILIIRTSRVLRVSIHRENTSWKWLTCIFTVQQSKQPGTEGATEIETMPSRYASDLCYQLGPRAKMIAIFVCRATDTPRDAAHLINDNNVRAAMRELPPLPLPWDRSRSSIEYWKLGEFAEQNDIWRNFFRFSHGSRAPVLVIGKSCVYHDFNWEIKM